MPLSGLACTQLPIALPRVPALNLNSRVGQWINSLRPLHHFNSDKLLMGELDRL